MSISIFLVLNCEYILILLNPQGHLQSDSGSVLRFKVERIRSYGSFVYLSFLYTRYIDPLHPAAQYIGIVYFSCDLI